MFNISDLSTCFAGLVGFKQSNDPSYPVINSALSKSDSGLYVEGAHPLITQENIYAVAPEFGSFTYPNWVTGVYPLNAIVLHSGKKYRAIQDVTAEIANPVTATTYWLEIDPYNDWLLNIYNQSISQLCYDLINYKKIAGVGKSLLDSMRLYEGFGTLSSKIVKRDRFVGWEVYVNNIENISIQINKLGFQGDTANPDFHLYLYHSSQKEYLKRVQINFDKPSSFQWKELEDVILNFYSANHDTDGVFYIGYYENELLGQAITREMNISSAPCAGCDRYNIDAFNKWSKRVKLKAISIDSSYLDEDKHLFDTSKVIEHADTNFGMNLAITVKCDLTDFFCSNKSLFADALQKQVALNILNKMAFSTKINVLSDKVRGLAMSELDEREESGSFKMIYIKSLKALNIDFSGFNHDCLPCYTNRNSYNFKPV